MIQPSEESHYLCIAMPKIATSFLFLICLITACREETRPYLPVEVMRDVLVEMHIADGYTERISKPIKYRNAFRGDLYQEVLAKHQLDETTFRETYDYYTAHPYEMDSLYQLIIEKLERQLTGEKNRRALEAVQADQKRIPKEQAVQKAPWQSTGDAENEP